MQLLSDPLQRVPRQRYPQRCSFSIKLDPNVPEHIFNVIQCFWRAPCRIHQGAELIGCLKVIDSEAGVLEELEINYPPPPPLLSLPALGLSQGLEKRLDRRPLLQPALAQSLVLPRVDYVIR